MSLVRYRVIAALFALGVLAGGGAAQVLAGGSGNSTTPPPGADFTVPVALPGPSPFSAHAFYSQSLGALHDSVSFEEYAVTGPATVAITVEDQGYVADYYQLYMDTDQGFSSPAPTLVGTTPQVHTDHNLVAPTYDPLWDGKGTTYSQATFTVTIGSGTTYFVLVDALFDAMGAKLGTACGGVTALLSVGCTVSGPNPISVTGAFSPASVSITFTQVAAAAPEFGSSSLVAVGLSIAPLLWLTRRRIPGRSSP